MQFIFGVIIFIIVVGAIAALVDWVKANKGLVTMLVAFIISWFIFGFIETIVIAIILFVIAMIIAAIINKIEINNQKKLLIHLKNNCSKLGYMNANKWRNYLPEYADKMYPTSFDDITKNFALQIERLNIIEDNNLSWLDPASKYLVESGMADVYELAQVPSEGLKWTHVTPNEKLIFDAMEKLSIVKKINDKKLINKINLDEEAVKSAHNFDKNKSIPKYLCVAYKIDDYFMNKKTNTNESNIESEEFSLDDL